MLTRSNESVAVDCLEGITAYMDLLASHGYDIALSGKWHLGDTMKKRKGYTYWNTILRGGCRYRAYDMYHDGAVTDHADYLTDRIANNAIDYLRRGRTGRPFYLGVHFTAPHTHTPWDRSEHPRRSGICTRAPILRASRTPRCTGTRWPTPSPETPRNAGGS